MSRCRARGIAPCARRRGQRLRFGFADGACASAASRFAAGDCARKSALIISAGLSALVASDFGGRFGLSLFADGAAVEAASVAPDFATLGATVAGFDFVADFGVADFAAAGFDVAADFGAASFAAAFEAADAFPLAAAGFDFAAGAVFDAGTSFAGPAAVALRAAGAAGVDAAFADLGLDASGFAGARGAGDVFAAAGLRFVAGGCAAAGAGATTGAAFAATSGADCGATAFDASGVMLSRRSFA